MHVISDQILLHQGIVGAIGGPIWFIQAWALTYFSHRLSTPLSTSGLMTDPLDESGPKIHLRSLGEKLLRIPMASKLTPEEFAPYMKIFLSEQPSGTPDFYPFSESFPFIRPTFLNLSQPFADSARDLLRLCITPAVLSIGFSKKGHRIHPSLEFYHPALLAWQFGFDAALPRLILVERLVR